MHGKRISLLANVHQHLAAQGSVVAHDFNLDEFMGVQVDVNFFHDRLGQALVADHDDRV